MGRPKKLSVEEFLDPEGETQETLDSNKISPIEVSFGNGDLNLLKEKINEIITRL